jgi:hypothetical protein
LNPYYRDQNAQFNAMLEAATAQYALPAAPTNAQEPHQSPQALEYWDNSDFKNTGNPLHHSPTTTDKYRQQFENSNIDEGMLLNLDHTDIDEHASGALQLYQAD